MSIAEKIFEKTQSLPEPTQITVLHFVEKLAHDLPVKKSPPKAGSAKGLVYIAPDFEPPTSPKPAPKFGSAKGLIHMADDFDAPLEDFKPYME